MQVTYKCEECGFETCWGAEDFKNGEPVCPDCDCDMVQVEEDPKKLLEKKNELIDALNRLDELASYRTQDNDDGEADAQLKDYTILFDFLMSL